MLAGVGESADEANDHRHDPRPEPPVFGQLFGDADLGFTVVHEFIIEIGFGLEGVVARFEVVLADDLAAGQRGGVVHRVAIIGAEQHFGPGNVLYLVEDA